MFLSSLTIRPSGQSTVLKNVWRIVKLYVPREGDVETIVTKHEVAHLLFLFRRWHCSPIGDFWGEGDRGARHAATRSSEGGRQGAGHPGRDQHRPNATGGSDQLHRAAAEGQGGHSDRGYWPEEGSAADSLLQWYNWPPEGRHPDQLLPGIKLAAGALSTLPLGVTRWSIPLKRAIEMCAWLLPYCPLVYCDSLRMVA